MFDRDSYMNEYVLRRYYKRKANGECTMCGVKLEPEHATLTCDGCRAKQKQRNAKHQLKLKRLALKEIKRKYS